MCWFQSPLVLVMFLAIGRVYAQAPTGVIAGIVTDATGARVMAARVIITNRDNGLTRDLVSSAAGDYSATSLPAGVYKVSVEAAGFRRLEANATVEAGTTTTLNLRLEVGELRDHVIVNDAAPVIDHESHQVG